ncbi:MAG: NusG domain II-containing protein [Oscillospiraceae bacterium]|jgi:hypothetical protein|nr:NusG domain II-containing protein [Oscillospiraceae bacterium]
MKWVSKRDLLAMAALLLAALLLLFLRPAKEDGARFEVLAGGQVILSGSLKPDREFVLSGYPGVTLSIRDQRIAFTRSDCPDKTCVRTGYISGPGQVSACLPNGLVVRVVGGGGVDMVLKRAVREPHMECGRV